MGIFLKKEVLFVKFPILFPLVYLFCLYLFPQYETQIILITILLLAETHFGATWPFFINKINKNFIFNKKISLIYIPIFITILCFLGFFFSKNLFLLIFFACNVFHVCRQSFGIMNLYTVNPIEKKNYSFLIYFFNLFFFIIAFFRFYIPLIEINDLIFLNLIVVILIASTILFQLIKFGFSEHFLTLITGILIFYPVCFVQNPVHAIIMGVTMHYSQYLFLTNKVIFKRKRNDLNNKNTMPRFWLTVFIYSAIMTFFSIFAKNDSDFLKNLIVIPIVGQMLHFYLDSQLWKFSEKHNRDNILKYIKI